LNREGHEVNAYGDAIPIIDDFTTNEAYIWEKVQVYDEQLFINRATEQVSIGVNADLQYARKMVNKGGVLSDEMGLGKTVRSERCHLL
jgi:SNF2 family DNA or RNA helicase